MATRIIIPLIVYFLSIANELNIKYTQQHAIFKVNRIFRYCVSFKSCQVEPVETSLFYYPAFISSGWQSFGVQNFQTDTLPGFSNYYLITFASSIINVLWHQNGTPQSALFSSRYFLATSPARDVFCHCWSSTLEIKIFINNLKEAPLLVFPARAGQAVLMAL